MELSTVEQDGVAVMRVVGDLNAASSGRLEEALERLLKSGHTRLVFDLSEVRYVSSAGLRVLLIAAKRLAGGGVVCLAGVNPAVRQVLEITGLLGVLRLVPSVAEAVAQARA